MLRWTAAGAAETKLAKPRRVVMNVEECIFVCWIVRLLVVVVGGSKKVLKEDEAECCECCVFVNV